MQMAFLSRFLFFIIIILGLLVANRNTYALCCNYGTSEGTAGKSCSDILEVAPGCRDLSGYYWIERTNGSVTQVYCEMSALEGGWERIAYYDSTTATECPGTMGEYQLGSHLVCTNNNGSSNVTSAEYYPVIGTYSEVKGLVTGFSSGMGHAFQSTGSQNKNLNELYMDGISVGIADDSGFIKHLHSIVITDQSLRLTNQGCYITAQELAFPPFVVGSDRTCSIMLSTEYMPLNGVYTSDIKEFGDMWGGTCDEAHRYYCRVVHRYFHKIIPDELTSAENPVLVRVMSRDSIVLGMKFLDIYVR